MTHNFPERPSIWMGGILLLAAIAGLLAYFVLSGGHQGSPPIGPGDRATDNLDDPPIEPRSGVGDPAERMPADVSSIRPQNPGIRLFFKDGSDASLLRMYGCISPVSIHERQFLSAPPTWQGQTDEGGWIDLDTAQLVAPLGVVRTAPDMALVIPIDPIPGDLCILPSIILQQFTLDVTDGDKEITVTMELVSKELLSFALNASNPTETKDGDFIDNSTIALRPIDSHPNFPLVIVRKTFSLSRDKRSIELELHPGTYRMRSLHSSFGYWVDQSMIEVPGPPVLVEAQSARIVTLGNIVAGPPKFVRTVLLLHHFDDGQSTTRGEQEIHQWEATDSELHVPLNPGPRSSTPWRSYGLRVVWSNGKSQSTDYMPWGSLQGFIALQD